MIKRSILVVMCGVVLLLQSVNLVAQDTNIATHIPKSEIMAALQGITNLPDQQARVVDIGGGINVAVGILRRLATSPDGTEPYVALAHHQVTEVYYVVAGAGVLVTGGDVQSEREIPPDSEIVRELVGPTARRTITNGETMVISEGDVVVIPAGVAHGFSKILDGITYLSIRVDADQVLPAGYKHPLID